MAEAPLRERRWGQLMLALYGAIRQGEALGAYQRTRSLLAHESGSTPGRSFEGPRPRSWRKMIRWILLWHNNFCRLPVR